MSQPCLLAETKPRLLVDGVLLTSSLDVVAPELVSALDPVPPRRAYDSLVGRSAPGPTVAARLDAAGVTAPSARAELAETLRLAVVAHTGLPQQTRRRLGWPPEAAWLTADRWLVAYATEPARWPLDMVGGLTPATLLRCCLMARPDALVELWLDRNLYGPPRVHGVQPEPAPMAAQSARTLLRRPKVEGVNRHGDKPRSASGC